MLKKINQIIYTIVVFFIIYCVAITVGDIFKNDFISYLVDLFIVFEVFCFLDDFLKEQQ